MTRIKVWVEVMSVQRWTERVDDVPPEWDSMSQPERDAFMRGSFEDLLYSVANGGWEEVE